MSRFCRTEWVSPVTSLGGARCRYAGPRTLGAGLRASVPAILRATGSCGPGRKNSTILISFCSKSTRCSHQTKTIALLFPKVLASTHDLASLRLVNSNGEFAAQRVQLQRNQSVPALPATTRCRHSSTRICCTLARATCACGGRLSMPALASDEAGSCLRFPLLTNDETFGTCTQDLVQCQILRELHRPLLVISQILQLLRMILTLFRNGSIRLHASSTAVGRSLRSAASVRTYVGEACVQDDRGQMFAPPTGEAHRQCLHFRRGVGPSSHQCKSHAWHINYAHTNHHAAMRDERCLTVIVVHSLFVSAAPSIYFETKAFPLVRLKLMKTSDAWARALIFVVEFLHHQFLFKIVQRLFVLGSLKRLLHSQQTACQSNHDTLVA